MKKPSNAPGKRYYVVDSRGWYLERTDLGYWFSKDISDAKEYSEEEADECIICIKSDDLMKVEVAA